jgi:Cof subfamily protein (haloacid dehalogenase superfamily)
MENHILTVPPSRRIAFLDVDGTILDHGTSVAPSTVKAITTARAAGHLVYLSTGRSAGDIHPDVRAIGFDGAITNGGAFATSGDETVLARTMPVDALTQLTDYFDTHGIQYFLQSDTGVYASANVRRLMTEMVQRLRGELDPSIAPRFRDLSEADRAQIAKAVFMSESPGMVEQVQNDLGDTFHVVPGSMPLPGGSNGEVGMRGTTKGSAILHVLDRLGADPATAIGIGDSWNDVEMFEVCGIGIAMGNADPELQALADEVTTSVTSDGVYNAFLRHGLV